MRRIAFLVLSVIVNTQSYGFKGGPAIRRGTNELSVAENDNEGHHIMVADDTSVEIDKIKFDKWKRNDLYGKTLVDQTLTELSNDEEFQDTLRRIEDLGPEKMTHEERTKRRRALDHLGVTDFDVLIRGKNIAIARKDPIVLQINIGMYCNQACSHCHVESSPLRTEMMTSETTAEVLKLLQNSPSIKILDITGGAPELNENFRYLVRMARAMRPDLDIIDRCNLTVLKEPGQEDLVDFLLENRVHIVASLPCYSAENVDMQRGNGVFERSISALLAMNDAGYGIPNSGLELDLVYNPLGAFLPPPQESLEAKYKEELAENFGILFNHLFTMTNMPVKRFADFLHRRGELQEYMNLLLKNFNADTTERLMCMDTISVGWDGHLFDCDFNQQLGYVLGSDDIHQSGMTVYDVTSLDEMRHVPIRHDNHCFGCTAGMGSS